MSSRLKRKLGDLGVDTSSSRANESFCLIGTPLPPLEKSRDTGEFVPLWKQDVRDEKGRRRLHGAFTGGFSAGYFNTVGSKEGWAPSTFVSSRGEKAKQKVARPEDFMDEEDLQELRDSRKLVDTADEMDLTGGAMPGVDEPEKDSIAATLQASLLPPPTESVGARILKKMGWRIGQGIGPRITLRQRRMQDYELSSGSKAPSDLADVHDDHEEAQKHTYARRDTKLLLVDRKDNSHGLGYSPGMGLHESLGVKGGKGVSAGPNLAAGFGLGALNEADEDDLDVYDGGLHHNRRREAYDIIEHNDDDTVRIGSKSERAKKSQVRPASSTSYFRDGQPVLVGFVLSDKPVAEDRLFPLPDVPKGWAPDPRRVWDINNKENIGQRVAPNIPGKWDSRISADERGSLLGETPLPSGPRSVFDFMSQKDRQRLQNIAAGKAQVQAQPPAAPASVPLPPETIRIPRTEPHVAQAALRGFQPFASDPAKQSRYNSYLHSQLGEDSAGPPLQPLPDQRTDAFNKEVEDYAKAALLFKPISGAMAGRFTSAAVVEHGPMIHEGLHTPSAEEMERKEVEERKKEEESISPKAHAARMGMYGPLTRETTPWQPAKLLCKRFKVKDPELVPETPEDTAAVPPASEWEQQKQEFAASTSTGGVGIGGGAKREGPRDISNIGLGEDEDQGRDTLTYQRPAMDVFKAIFASDDEESEDETKVEEEEENISPPQILPAEPSIITESTATPSASTSTSLVLGRNELVDLNTFKPTFIPREGKAKKEKDKERGRDKEKKEKKKKEKRAVLSFAMDEEGGEETVLPKPKKKKRKDQDNRRDDDDDGMWVEKPAPEAVNVLMFAPPPSSAESAESTAGGGPPKGRKRAVDFM
ncbi:G patch domain-containing protein 1 [Hypsizygus marmoreus]|uniref:G patch domain-containing protein 1 n=1 Tax=Hypsizygus marmoreus TaxID=39966 RepID=A0A369JID0_HYPMA|nr:G patch domain-containing protein 1 [Hypsizygus marmoreus]